MKKVIISGLFFVLTLCAFQNLATVANADGFFENVQADLLYDADRPEDAVSASFRDAVRKFMNYFISFFGLFAVAMLVYAGAMMITAAGDDGQIGKGKKIIQWVLIGIVIVLLSYAIVSFIVGAGSSAA